jgi:hypothetical protein
MESQLLGREKTLFDDLAAASGPAVGLFAAACAERLRPVLRFTQADAEVTVGVALDMLWRVLEGIELPNSARLDELAQACRAAVPCEDESWNQEDAYIEDAIAATYYALEAYRLQDPQQAIWAARRGHESADYWVLNRLPGSAIDAKAEEACARNPLVRAELERQDRDARETNLTLTSGETLAEAARRFHRRAREEGDAFATALLSDPSRAG